MDLIKKYKDYKELTNKYSYILFVLSFDCETDCPKRDRAYSQNVQEFIEGKLIDITTSSEYQETIESLYKIRETLDTSLKLQIEEDFKDLNRIKKVPREELLPHFENQNRAGLFWKEGKESLDFSKFEKELKELVEFNKKYIKWQNRGFEKPLDTLLDEHEDGFTTKKYDEFFDLFKKELVPFIKHVLNKEKKYNKKLDTLKFDINKQKILTEFIIKHMGYTNEKGCVRETMHPFTSGANSNDVRITTSYDESLLFSNLYSVMHEAGHALYELGVDEKYNGTSLFGGTSMGIHESQSRFMENYLGRSRGFIKFLYPHLKNLFKEELEGISEDDIYYYVNSVSNQLTRTEADELTYTLHIIIRYEVEKALFNENLKVEEIEPLFNKLFKEYLNNEPKNKAQGCYQDVHWSSDFGYFPTYALGNAYAAQFFYYMKKDLDIDSLLEQGDFKEINKWLDSHIHKYGKSKKNLEIVRLATGEDFNPKYYIDYLIKKYSEIYDI
jgi:carboxypeptidase Taq